MELEQSFEVTAPLARVWATLVDAERVTACLPGAAVGARGADGGHEGEFRVKIGPSSAAYGGRVHVSELDDVTHRAVVEAAGTDRRGQGGARATIACAVTEAAPDRTRVVVAVDYRITGRLARFGRGGTVEEILGRLADEFRANLEAELGEASGVTPGPSDTRSAPEPSAPEPSAPEPSTPEPSAPEEPPASQPSEPQAVPEPSGPVVVRRVRENPAPFVALVAGFLLALRILRRRG